MLSHKKWLNCPKQQLNVVCSFHRQLTAIPRKFYIADKPTSTSLFLYHALALFNQKSQKYNIFFKVFVSNHSRKITRRILCSFDDKKQVKHLLTRLHCWIFLPYFSNWYDIVVMTVNHWWCQRQLTAVVTRTTLNCCASLVLLYIFFFLRFCCQLAPFNSRINY